jgi:hypothetical protein
MQITKLHLVISDTAQAIDHAREIELDAQDERVVEEFSRVRSFLGHKLPISEKESILKSLFEWKTDNSITNNAFENLCRILQVHFPDQVADSSMYHADHLLQKNIPLSPRVYHQCVKGCMAFTGDYETLSQCLYCKSDRHKRNSKNPQSVFRYWSPLSQIRLEMLSEKRRELFRHRHKHMQLHTPNEWSSTFADCFDGSLFYHIVRNTAMTFENEFDFSFSFTTDGFQVFKK